VLVDLDGNAGRHIGSQLSGYAAALAEVGLPIEREVFDKVAQGRNWKQFLPAILANAGLAKEPATLRNASHRSMPG